MYYFFQSMDDFDTWHNSLCEQLGFPKPSILQATGEINPLAPMSKVYTTPMAYNNGFIAFVEDKYAEGLTLFDGELPKPE